MSVEEFKKDLWDSLTDVPSAKIIARNQIVMRCPICGDSKKDPNKKRFYVKLDLKDNNSPVLYHCFNCESSGILTPSLLRSLDINNLTLNSNLLSYNKKSLKNIKKSLGLNNNEFNFKIPKPRDNNSNKLKMDYLNNRLGLNLSLDNWARFKVIFSLNDFMKLNNIETLTTSYEKANLLESDYVGFLTSKQEFINFRLITNNKEAKRYEKYTIYKNLDNSRKFYTIPMYIDLLTSEPIYINIAEGVFDILGVYFHVREQNLRNNIYVAVCGSGYLSPLQYFIKLGVFGKNVIVNIYSDNEYEKSPWYYRNIVKEIGPFVGKINLYYNDKSKDFGVPKKQIEVIHKRIP